ncbi:MAG: DUF945 family protein [Burkholderiaceae bacterium]
MKTTAIAAALIAAAGATYAGATYVSSSSFERTLGEMKRESPGMHGLKLTQTEHHHGLLGSQGRLRLALDPQCVAPELDLDLAVDVRYRVRHTPGLGGVSSFEAELVLPPTTPAEVLRVIGTDVLVRASGHVGFTGNTTARFDTPQIEHRDGDTHVFVAASSGTIVGQGQASKVNWAIPRVSIDADGQQITLNGIGARAEIKDPVLGTGQSVVTVDSIVGQDLRIEGLELASSTTERGELLDSVVSPKVRQVMFQQQRFENLGATFAMRGLDTHSVRRLSEIGNSGCGEQMFTEHNLLEAESAFARLFQRGLSIALTQVGGKLPQGSVNAGIEFGLAPIAKGSYEPLINRVSARGNVEAAQGLMMPEQRDMLLDMGLAQLRGDSMSAEFSFAQGRLMINGRQDDNGFGDMIRQLFEQGDEQLVQWQDGLQKGQPALAALLPMLRAR